MRPYFAAAGADQVKDLLDCRVRNILCSFAHFRRGFPDALVAAVKRGSVNLMIDSGAYTNASKPGSVVYADYVAFLKAIDVKAEYIVLDDLKKRTVTLTNYGRMKGDGLRPMLVDHMWYPWTDHLAPVYRSGERICWGGLLTGRKRSLSPVADSNLTAAAIAKRLDARAEYARKGPASRVHFLGLGARIRNYLPWMDCVESWDSASWAINSGGFGKAFYVENDENGWPRMRWAHHTQAKEPARELARRHGLKLADYHDRRKAAIIAFSDYFKRFEARYNKAVAAHEDLAKAAEGDWGIPDEADPFRVFINRRDTATIASGTDGDLEPIAFEDVVSQLDRPIVLREPFVSVVGSLANHKESRNDIDVLVHGPLDEATRRAVEFRIGRALEPKASARVQYHDEEMGGPFTDHAHLYDLVLVPRKDARVVTEMAAKQDDPHLDVPKAVGPQPAVLQVHTRGKSAHMDLRLKVDDFLVGWTLFAQRPGVVPDVDTVAEARALYRGYTPKDGNRFFKPILSPSRMQTGAKLRQPVEWLAVDGKVIGEGEVGATSREEGVIVAVEKPAVEYGVQNPHFHEYFLTGKTPWAGPLYVRLLLGRNVDGKPERTPEGRPFWTAMLSRNALPSILNRRSVARRRMPPDTVSGMPKTLMDVTPKEYRYWTAKGDEAREMRDALVESGWFTEDNVRIVDGQFRRIVSKHYVYAPDVAAKAEPKKARWALSWLFWRGPMQVRTGPSRQVWLLMVDDPDGGVEAWELQSDPRAEMPVSAIRRHYDGKGLLAADRHIEPGERIDGNVLNPTKDTPAWIRRQDHGDAMVTRNQDGSVSIEVDGRTLRGRFTVTPEEKGSDIWVLERKAEKADVDDCFRWRQPGAPPVEVRKALSPKDQASYDAETATIAANVKKPAAKQWHVFKQAEWTFPNGHPRCLVCGGEERIGSICNPSRAEQALAIKRVAFGDWDFGGGDHKPPPCQHRYANRKACGKDASGVFIEGKVADASAHRRAMCRQHIAEAVRAAVRSGLRKAGGDVSPGERFRPVKPRGGQGVGVFNEVKPLLERWASPEALTAGVAVEPKWNGMRTVASRKANGPKDKRVSVWFEDSGDERAHILPGVAEELDAIGGSFVLDSELVDVKEDGTVEPRSSLARFTGPVKPQEDGGVRLRVFRVLHWDRDGGSLVDEDEDAAAATLARFMRHAKSRTGLTHIEPTARKVAHTAAELKAAIEWARKVPGSEGAMLKRLDAPYSLDGASSAWVKLKTIRRINALVYDRRLVSGTDDTYTYSAAVGPITAADGFDPKETVEHGGKLWAIIGRTANSNVEAKPGDVIQAAIFELKVNRRDGKRRVHWFGPPTVEMVRDDRKPDTVDTVERMALGHEVTKALEAEGVDRLTLLKTKEEQFVLGVVLEPNDGEGEAPMDPDTQRDIYSAEDVRASAHRFMEDFRNVGHMHRTLVNGRVKILESFLSPTEFWVEMDGTTHTAKPSKTDAEHVRKGTWLLGLHVADKAMWEKVKRGELTGLSIGGSARRVQA
jgi:ATP-dependent DNA ligase